MKWMCSRGWRVLTLAITWIGMGCHHHDEHEPHKHHDEHPAGHDHHQPGHGHGDTPVVVTTLWSDTYELFSEHSPGQVGEPVSFLIHLTTLSDFRALEVGSIAIEFEGPEKLRAETKTFLRPGIYELEVTPSKAGDYRGRLVVTGPHPGSVGGIDLKVFETEKQAAASVPEHDEAGLIIFLKEQQWGIPFNTAFVTTKSVLPSAVVSGTISTPPGGRAVVGAPVTGRLVSPAGGLLRPGTPVRKGQVLALLSPAPSSPEAVSRAQLAVAKAQARVDAANSALERAERLIRDEAISQREVEESRREQTVAAEALAAAISSAALFSGARDARGQGAWRLTSPIDGTLTEILAMPGATVSPGETLFKVVDTRELWVVARIPEQDLPRLEAERDASFQPAGFSEWMPIRLSGDSPTASLVTVGRTVDPISRTVDVIYALNESDSSLRVGGTVRVSVPVGSASEGVAVQRSALLDQDGRAVVYVQVDGEHFEERAVRTGDRAGDWVSVVEGLEVGERIVTKGTHVVRLAGRSGGDTPHGHVH